MTTTRYTLHEQFHNCQDLLLNIKSYFKSSDELIHDARNKLKVIDFEGQQIVVKAFRVPNLLNQLVYGTLRDSKAKKSFEHSLKLQELQITCPMPIGYIEFHDGLFLKESFFLSQRSNYDFTIREPLLVADWPDHDRIFRQFGEFTADLHEKGVLHNDYSPGNILVTKLESGDYKFDLVDINRMRFGPLSYQEKMKNLSKLWADESDMRLIATAYAEKMGYDSEKTARDMIYYDRRNKNIKTFKRRLKGEK